MTDESLWPDDLRPAPARGAAPLTVLREQAEHLRRLTGGRVWASVGTETYDNGDGRRQADQLVLRRADAEGSITWVAVEVEHAYGTPYPARLDFGKRLVECPDHAAFVAALREALHSPRVRAIVAELMGEG